MLYELPAELMRVAAPQAIVPVYLIDLHACCANLFLASFLSQYLCFYELKMSQYTSWTLLQLKEELKKRGVRVSGRKNELVER